MTRDTYSVTLIDYADKAMYHSKKTGRNRTTFFEDLVASGAEKYEEVATGDITLF
jgi:predicted signal transduction protein with EAL and GGDEF domain